ncbi:hypothetical protein [Bifidobacterium saguinibicoloris]|uniref:hypothetical protein n=1 Tax=Bifidobacterium saguinibicoloris TaxID=2834433 RepID=UPI001C57DB8B|nr:hypothetical protein [Bifidobacterium saguinibicoloris]MBW3079881.1 hypothetical protein [Bifidobacterium saguinibicoloris]
MGHVGEEETRQRAQTELLEGPARHTLLRRMPVEERWRPHLERRDHRDAQRLEIPKDVRLQSGDRQQYGYSNGKIPDYYPDAIKDGELRFLRVDDMQPTDSLLEGGQPSFKDVPAYAKPWVADPDTVRSWNEWKLQRTHRDDTVWRQHSSEYDNWAESTPPSQ